MARKSTQECSELSCSELPFLRGLCKEHFDSLELRERRRKEALAALHDSLIKGQPLKSIELRDELLRLQLWWCRACDAVNHQLKNTVLADEANYAVEWCIALAQEIVDAEIAFREGRKASNSLDATREWVWPRFHNLEAGLMSNGVARPALPLESE